MDHECHMALEVDLTANSMDGDDDGTVSSLAVLFPSLKEKYIDRKSRYFFFE